MKKVRTVIWDCDNLMWFHKKDEAKIVAEEIGIAKKDFQEFEAEFFKMLDTFNKYFASRKVTMKETLDIIYREMPILHFYDISPEVYFKMWNNMHLQTSDFNPDTIELMKYLKEKNIKNIIKSDWWRDVQEKMLHSYGVIDYIEEIHCCDNSYLKSNPLSTVGIIKSGREEQYVIIGDSLGSDIAFAEHAGIKSIWLNRSGEKNTSQFRPTYEVASLLDVMEII